MQSPLAGGHLRRTTKMTNESVQQKNKKRKHKIIGELIKVNGRVIGQVIGDTGYKDVSSKKHFLHYPEEAIAFTISALEAMRNAGAEFVEIFDTDTGRKYKTTITKYFEYGEKFNYGFGDQIKLTLPNFLQTIDHEYISTSTDTDVPQYSEATETKPLYYKSHATVGVVLNGVQQLSLFNDNKGGE
jgi:hypothetical protein